MLEHLVLDSGSEREHEREREHWTLTLKLIKKVSSVDANCCLLRQLRIGSVQ